MVVIAIALNGKMGRDGGVDSETAWGSRPLTRAAAPTCVRPLAQAEPYRIRSGAHSGIPPSAGLLMETPSPLAVHLLTSLGTYTKKSNSTPGLRPEPPIMRMPSPRLNRHLSNLGVYPTLPRYVHHNGQMGTPPIDFV
ncbi:hypothetical protein CHU98_g5690 [Xylaria longipes]|nr:hypothetical protein CHU98_g5690 [Xylaria longipes]